MTVWRQFIDGPYGQLHVRTARAASNHGDDTTRAPLMCLHMSPKSSWQYIDLLPEIARHRDAVAPDYPGHGESDLPPPEPHVQLEDYARCMWTVADALGGGPLHLLGSHTGAMVAVEMAHQRPGDVLGIVSQSAPVMTDEEIAAFSDAYAPIPLDEAGTRFTRLWARVLEHRGPNMPLTLCAESFAENLRSGDAYEWGHRAAFDYAPRYRDRLTSIATPILVLNVNDDLCEHSRRADALMQHGQRLELPEWGHGFLSVHADDTAHIIERFCREVEAA
ncbi:MAG: alpha/beta fold hydrolase [Pseudomonadota bacterium]